MNGKLPTIPKHFRRMGAAYLVLLLSVIPTVIAYRRVRENVAARDQARFDQALQSTRDALFQRIESFLSALRGVRGLIEANPTLRLDEWQRYAHSIDLEGNYRGILDIGFAERVSRAEREGHVAAMRAAGYPDYAIVTGSERDEYFPIVYLSSTANATNWAPGWDVSNEPQRGAAMEQARRTDRPIATGKVTLLTALGPVPDPGLVIYLPVYRNGVKPANEEAQKEATIGFVFASLVARELGATIIGSQTNRLVAVEVFDGDAPSAENLLYDSDVVLAAGDPAFGRRLSKSVAVEGLGRTWTIRFSTLPAFELDSRNHLPRIALFGGLTISLLLFGVVWVQVRARSAAELLTGELRQSEQLLKQSNEELRARIQERQQVEDALAAEKERLAVTLRSIGDGVITTDIAGKIVLMNKAAENLTGWARDEVPGRPLSEVFRLLDENSRERLGSPVEQILNSGPAVNRGSPAVLIARPGRERIVIVTSAPIHDHGDHVIGAVLVFRDITENRKLEAELHKASKLESLGLLAGGIAHDFNNILTGIFGNISLAKMFVLPDSPIQERLEKAEQACHRAKEMTGQLLTFARGGAPIKRVKSVPQLLKESCEIAVLGANVRCDSAYAPGLRPVEVDQGQLTQVLNNLLLNAVQAMPAGGTIRVRAENFPAGTRPGLPAPAADYVRISIQDHGPGIAPEHLSRVFDPFFTTKHKGRGLGLATAYSIIRKHDGLIEVESQAGQGATFHIYLPASAQPMPPDPEDKNQPLTGRGRVLVMDDEPEILNFSQVALKRLGYETELARDGAEAIRRYREAREAGHPFAVVIMDLTIPGGMGGKEAIKHLLDVDPQARAIVSSGYSNDPVMSEFSKYGFRGVVAKPYEIRQLARVLRDVLGPEESQPVQTPA